VHKSTAWQAQLKSLFPAFDWQRSDCFISAFADRQSCENLYQKLGKSALLVRLLCSAREGLLGGDKDGAALRFGLPRLCQQQTILDRIKTG
jgi:hypothetical protein